MAFDFAGWLAVQPPWDSAGDANSPDTGYTEYNLFRQRDLIRGAIQDKQYSLLPYFATVAGAIGTFWRDDTDNFRYDGEIRFYHNPWLLRRDWTKIENEQNRHHSIFG